MRIIPIRHCRMDTKGRAPGFWAPVIETHHALPLSGRPLLIVPLQGASILLTRWSASSSTHVQTSADRGLPPTRIIKQRKWYVQHNFYWSITDLKVMSLLSRSHSTPTKILNHKPPTPPSGWCRWAVLAPQCSAQLLGRPKRLLGE